MSLTPLIWLSLLIVQSVLSFKRPVWAIGLYMQTFFAAPHLWWWGDEIPSARYALWAGVVLLVAVIAHGSSPTDQGEPRAFSMVRRMAILVALNSTFVHFFIASRPDISIDNYAELMKYVLLFFMMSAAIRDRQDFRVALMSIAIGAAYIGYEVTINGRGEFSGSRLEGVGAPAAQGANSLADVMLISLPLVGSLMLHSSWLAKAASVGASPLVLNVLLLCNSRGAFLGLFGGALSFFLAARGPVRKKALRTLAVGGVVLYMLLGDPAIFSRFVTTFVGSEERDNSAESRLDFWRAGLLMLWDYPLGDGGGAFKDLHGSKYLGAATGADDPESRSLHNGYLTEATDWGVQGLVLKLLFMGGALLAAYRTTNRARIEGRLADSLFGLSIFVSGAALMIHCFFGSFLSNEWAYWIAALLLRYSEVYAHGEATAGAQKIPAAA